MPYGNLAKTGIYILITIKQILTALPKNVPVTAIVKNGDKKSLILSESEEEFNNDKYFELLENTKNYLILSNNSNLPIYSTINELDITTCSDWHSFAFNGTLMKGSLDKNLRSNYSVIFCLRVEKWKRDFSGKEYVNKTMEVGGLRVNSRTRSFVYQKFFETKVDFDETGTWDFIELNVTRSNDFAMMISSVEGQTFQVRYFSLKSEFNKKTKKKNYIISKEKFKFPLSFSVRNLQRKLINSTDFVYLAIAKDENKKLGNEQSKIIYIASESKEKKYGSLDLTKENIIGKAKNEKNFTAVQGLTIFSLVNDSYFIVINQEEDKFINYIGKIIDYWRHPTGDKNSKLGVSGFKKMKFFFEVKNGNFVNVYTLKNQNILFLQYNRAKTEIQLTQCEIIKKFDNLTCFQNFNFQILDNFSGKKFLLKEQKFFDGNLISLSLSDSSNNRYMYTTQIYLAYNTSKNNPEIKNEKKIKFTVNFIQARNDTKNFESIWLVQSGNLYLNMIQKLKGDMNNLRQLKILNNDIVRDPVLEVDSTLLAPSGLVNKKEIKVELEIFPSPTLKKNVKNSLNERIKKILKLVIEPYTQSNLVPKNKYFSKSTFVGDSFLVTSNQGYEFEGSLMKFSLTPKSGIKKNENASWKKSLKLAYNEIRSNNLHFFFRDYNGRKLIVDKIYLTDNVILGVTNRLKIFPLKCVTMMYQELDSIKKFNFKSFNPVMIENQDKIVQFEIVKNCQYQKSGLENFNFLKQEIEDLQETEYSLVFMTSVLDNHKRFIYLFVKPDLFDAKQLQYEMPPFFDKFKILDFDGGTGSYFGGHHFVKLGAVDCSLIFFYKSQEMEDDITNGKINLKNLKKTEEFNDDEENQKRLTVRYIVHDVDTTSFKKLKKISGIENLNRARCVKDIVFISSTVRGKEISSNLMEALSFTYMMIYGCRGENEKIMMIVLDCDEIKHMVIKFTSPTHPKIPEKFVNFNKYADSCLTVNKKGIAYELNSRKIIGKNFHWKFVNEIYDFDLDNLGIEKILYMKCFPAEEIAILITKLKSKEKIGILSLNLKEVDEYYTRLLDFYTLDFIPPDIKKAVQIFTVKEILTGKDFVEKVAIIQITYMRITYRRRISLRGPEFYLTAKFTPEGEKKYKNNEDQIPISYKFYLMNNLVEKELKAQLYFMTGTGKLKLSVPKIMNKSQIEKWKKEEKPKLMKKYQNIRKYQADLKLKSDDELRKPEYDYKKIFKLKDLCTIKGHITQVSLPKVKKLQSKTGEEKNLKMKSFIKTNRLQLLPTLDPAFSNLKLEKDISSISGCLYHKKKRDYILTFCTFPHDENKQVTLYFFNIRTKFSGKKNLNLENNSTFLGEFDFFFESEEKYLIVLLVQKIQAVKFSGKGENGKKEAYSFKINVPFVLSFKLSYGEDSILETGQHRVIYSDKDFETKVKENKYQTLKNFRMDELSKIYIWRVDKTYKNEENRKRISFRILQIRSDFSGEIKLVKMAILKQRENNKQKTKFEFINYIAIFSSEIKKLPVKTKHFLHFKLEESFIILSSSPANNTLQMHVSPVKSDFDVIAELKYDKRRVEDYKTFDNGDCHVLDRETVTCLKTSRELSTIIEQTFRIPLKGRTTKPQIKLLSQKKYKKHTKNEHVIFAQNDKWFGVLINGLKNPLHNVLFVYSKTSSEGYTFYSLPVANFTEIKNLRRSFFFFHTYNKGNDEKRKDSIFVYNTEKKKFQEYRINREIEIGFVKGMHQDQLSEYNFTVENFQQTLSSVEDKMFLVLKSDESLGNGPIFRPETKETVFYIIFGIFSLFLLLVLFYLVKKYRLRKKLESSEFERNLVFDLRDFEF